MIQRGQVYSYEPIIGRPGQSRARLVVSADPINANDDWPTVLTLLVHDYDRGGLLSVRLGEIGWAAALAPESSLRTRLGQLVHTCTDDELDSVNTALRAALDL